MVAAGFSLADLLSVLQWSHMFVLRFAATFRFVLYAHITNAHTCRCILHKEMLFSAVRKRSRLCWVPLWVQIPLGSQLK